MNERNKLFLLNKTFWAANRAKTFGTWVQGWAFEIKKTKKRCVRFGQEKGMQDWACNDHLEFNLSTN